VVESFLLRFCAPASPVDGWAELDRLLRGQEKSNSQELAWNWRDSVLQIVQCNLNRGEAYNGYPNSPGYFGSYCMDGLAVALHSFAHSHSFVGCTTFVN
jgi:hypothetical protein